MGRKLRLSKRRMELEPSFVVVLMSGVYSGTSADDPRHDERAWGIKGRWALAFAEGDHINGRGPDPLAEAWETCGDDLTEEAAGYGFRPFYILEGEWTEAERKAEQQWRDDYLAEHGRPGHVGDKAS